jgi:uncharacterized protein (UPF0333 family)
MRAVIHMRGQLSLEFLLLFAIFLAALAILSIAAFNTNNSAKSTVNGLLSQKALSDISNIANDLCVLGEGNGRQLRLSFAENVSLLASGRNITITYNNDVFSRTVTCEVSDTELIVKDTVLNIEKNGSKIRITSLP